MFPMDDRRDDDSPEIPGEEDVVMVDAPSETLEEILAQEEAEARRAADPGAAELEGARRQIAELHDRELRKLAEFENFKKRTEREKSDYFRFALGDFFRDLLPVLDNFERALGHAPAAADDEYRQGIELIYDESNAIVAVLQKGYYLNDRLLRPAFVKVAIPPHEEKG